MLADAEADAAAAGTTGAAVEQFFRRVGEEPAGPVRTAGAVVAEVGDAFAARIAFW